MIDVGITRVPRGRNIYLRDRSADVFFCGRYRQNRHILTYGRSHEEKKDVPRVVNGTGSYGDGWDRSC